MKTSVIGLGKVGLPLVAVLADSGSNVVGVDYQKIINTISLDSPSFKETGLNNYLKKNRKRIIFTSDYQKAINNSDITFIIVPTPSKKNGEFDIQFVKKVIESISSVLKKKQRFHTIVISSTVMPGHTAELSKFVENKTKLKCGKDFGLIYCPWFIALGNVINNLINPDFVLIGESDRFSGSKLEKFFIKNFKINKIKIFKMNFVNAEISKLSLNAYVTAKISFANTLAYLCEKVKNANAEVICKAIGMDKRVGLKYLKGSTPFGGPCFPRDNLAFAALGKKIKIHTPLQIATNKINNERIINIYEIINKIKPKAKKISIFGLSYKENTDVIEESFSINLANYLINKKYKVTVFDFRVSYDQLLKNLNKNIFIAQNIYEIVNASFFYIFTLDSKEFSIVKKILPKNNHKIKVLDCWGNYNFNNKKIIYYQLGKYFDSK